MSNPIKIWVDNNRQAPSYRQTADQKAYHQISEDYVKEYIQEFEGGKLYSTSVEKKDIFGKGFLSRVIVKHPYTSIQELNLPKDHPVIAWLKETGRNYPIVVH